MNKNITDSAVTRDKHGKHSNAMLHEQMTEHVDDQIFRARTRQKLLDQGLSLSVVDSICK